MTAPEQQAAWPPPIGTRVVITVTCCGRTIDTLRTTWTGKDQALVVPICPQGNPPQHSPRITWTWSGPMSEQQAAPEPDLRQRIADAVRPVRWVVFTAADGCSATRDASPDEIADAVLAVVEPELAAARASAAVRRQDTTEALAELAALREQHRRALLAATESSTILQRRIDAQADDLAARDAENTRLRAALATAKAAGYRLAADNASEQRQLHGADADAEMLVHFLQRGAELHTQFAADHPEQYTASLPTT